MDASEPNPFDWDGYEEPVPESDDLERRAESESEIVEVGAVNPFHIVMIAVEKLIPHSENKRLFGDFVPATLDRALEASMRRGVTTTLSVCGTGCVSDPNTLLSGHRRCEAALRLGIRFLPCRVINNLTRDEEVAFLINSNIGEQATRKLSERAQHALEMEWLAIEGRRPGRPSKAGGTNAPPNNTAPVLPNLKAVAKKFGVSENSVKERKKVFGPMLTPRLEKALEDGEITRTPAAAIIRAAEKAGGTIEAKRAKVDSLIEEKRSRPRRATENAPDAEERVEALAPGVVSGQPAAAGVPAPPNGDLPNPPATGKFAMRRVIEDAAASLSAFIATQPTESQLRGMEDSVRRFVLATRAYLECFDKLEKQRPRGIAL